MPSTSDAAAKAMQRVPAAARHAEGYAVGALDVRNTVVERMRRLDRLEFEQLLRPAFRQDEWKLIAVGAVIGGLVGELEVLQLLHQRDDPQEDSVFDGDASWVVALAVVLAAGISGWLASTLIPAAVLGCAPTRWRGVVGRHAGTLAVDTADVLGRLITPSELLAAVDGQRLADEIGQPLLIAADEITRDVFAEQYPVTWETLPPLAQDVVTKQVQAAAPRIVAELTTALQAEADAVLDVRRLAVERLAGDSRLLAGIIGDVAGRRHRVAAQTAAGATAAGAIVATAYLLTGWVALAVVGLAAVGAGAGWLGTVTMLAPRRPRCARGRVVLHGEVHRRRTTVAHGCAATMAGEVLDVEHLTDALVHGPGSPTTARLVAETVSTVVADQAWLCRRLAAAAGTDRDDALAATAAAKATARLAPLLRRARGYLTGAVDVRGVLAARLRAADDATVEQLLRPAYRLATPAIIAAAGVAGAAAGAAVALLSLGT